MSMISKLILILHNEWYNKCVLIIYETNQHREIGQWFVFSFPNAPLHLNRSNAIFNAADCVLLFSCFFFAQVKNNRIADIEWKKWEK